MRKAPLDYVPIGHYETFNKLDCHINWRRVFDHIGFKTEPQDSYPTKTTCPLCHGDMTVYLVGPASHWFDCKKCGIQDDIIGVLKKKMRTKKGRTVAHRLIDMGLVSGVTATMIEDYEKVTEPRRAVIADIIAELKINHPMNYDKARTACHDRKLPCSRSPDRWMAVMSENVGAVDMPRLLDKHPEESAFLRSIQHTICANNKKRRPDSKKDAIEVFVPSWEAPGRLGGVWRLREGTFPGTGLVFHHVNVYGDVLKRSQEKDLPMRDCGVAFLRALETTTPCFGNTVFITSDVDTALALHGAYFKENDTHLPLLIINSVQRSAIALLAALARDHELVFWSAQADSGLFRQAKVLDGKVSTLMTRPKIPSFQIAAWLKQVQNDAKPWRHCLCNVFRKHGPAAARKIVHDLALNQTDFEQFLKTASSRNCATVTALLQPNKKFVLVPYLDRHYTVTESAIVDSKTEQVVSDVVGEVTDVYLCGVKKTALHGWIRYAGRRMTFQGDIKSLRNSLEENIMAWAIQNNYGVPRIEMVLRVPLIDFMMRYSKPAIKHARILPKHDRSTGFSYNECDVMRGVDYDQEERAETVETVDQTPGSELSEEGGASDS